VRKARLARIGPPVLCRSSIQTGSPNEDAVAHVAASLNALSDGRMAMTARVGASALSLSKLLLLIRP
jgi:hypothetical protein